MSHYIAVLWSSLRIMHGTPTTSQYTYTPIHDIIMDTWTLEIMSSICLCEIVKETYLYIMIGSERAHNMSVKRGRKGERERGKEGGREGEREKGRERGRKGGREGQGRSRGIERET